MTNETIKKLNFILQNEHPVDIIDSIKYYALTKEEIEKIIMLLSERG